MTKKKPQNDYTLSSGNLFADLGFPDADERWAKVNLAVQVAVLIKKKRLTQIRAAELLNLDQPKISALLQGKLSGFSLERLISFLTLLDQDVTIRVAPKKRSEKEAIVSVVLPKTKSTSVPRSENLTRPAMQTKSKK